MVVLDTDHLSLLGRQEGAAGRSLRARLEEIDGPLVTTVVTYEEQTRGWLALLAKVQSTDRMIEGYRHLSEHIEDYVSIRVLAFDREAARIFGELKGSRIRVGTMDLKIAAIILANQATLLSRNLGDFRKVPGLRSEDWSG